MSVLESTTQIVVAALNGQYKFISEDSVAISGYTTVTKFAKAVYNELQQLELQGKTKESESFYGK